MTKLLVCVFFFSDFDFFNPIKFLRLLKQAVLSFINIILIDIGGQCRSERVNITLTSELWNETLMNRESNEFRTLENNILSSVSYPIS